ncbi:FecR family protein [Dawidia soli]|uniref:FecR domain-containing protein n=1 Tax=Dawidia soli TaxID=2782352 RepID=A0AAP2D958_9BACT|nr:FecR domain-containing protein [Dawidia soli]MBT1687778.1 FecR domain-containing protein [Dawidia soli]
MDYYPLGDLIRRHRAGTLLPHERRQLENFWQRAMEDTSYLDNLSPEDRALLKETMFAETRRQIARLEQPARPWIYTAAAYRVAAAVLLLIVAGGILYWNASRMTTIYSPPGEQVSIILPDKSHVTLNGNSTLRYATDWKKEGLREVWIDGEAFFAVRHTELHAKFVVHAANELNVEVLGTKFNVRSRSERSEVMLTEGKVRLEVESSTEAPVYLHPGELATVVGNAVSTHSVEERRYTSWLHQTLVFDRTPLAEVAMLLRDTYGLDVTFAGDDLAARELSGEISSATVDDVLYAIAETFNLKVDRDGQQVTISSP